MDMHTLIDISRKNTIGFIVFLMVYQFSTYIANDMIMPGMPMVIASFHASESAIPTALTAYILGGGSLQLVLGPLSDHFGRRRVMLAGAILFLIFTIMVAFSTSITQFLLARFFQGMGLCFTMVVGYATLQEIFDAMDAIRLTAFLSNIAATAPLLGPLIGAVFLHFFPWRCIFIFIALLALSSLVGLWQCMPETVGVPRKNNIVCHPIPFHPKTICNNYKKLFFDKSFFFSMLSLGLLGIPSVTWIAISPLILMTGAKLSMFQYALWQLPIFGAEIIGTLILRFYSYKLPIKTLISFGSITHVSGLLLCGLLPWAISSYFIWLLPGLCLYGIGLGMTMSPLNRRTLFSTPIAKGVSAAFINMVVMWLSALGVESIKIIYTTHDNVYFGFFCSTIGIMYIISLFLSFYLQGKIK